MKNVIAVVVFITSNFAFANIEDIFNSAEKQYEASTTTNRINKALMRSGDQDVVKDSSRQDSEPKVIKAKDQECYKSVEFALDCVDYKIFFISTSTKACKVIIGKMSYFKPDVDSDYHESTDSAICYKRTK